jgi:hypothetical protein
MTLRRPRRAALLLAAIAAAAFAGCGAKGPPDSTPVREGLGINVGGLTYTVYITRELNLRDVEDRSYYRGPEAPPGSALYGVFLNVCNNHENGPTLAPAREFKIVDSQENEFKPLPLPSTNDFAYRPVPLKHKACNPALGSIPSQSPTGGAMLLFQLPQKSVENRPLELQIQGPFDVQAGKAQVRHVDLDI